MSLNSIIYLILTAITLIFSYLAVLGSFSIALRRDDNIRVRTRLIFSLTGLLSLALFSLFLKCITNAGIQTTITTTIIIVVSDFLICFVAIKYQKRMSDDLVPAGEKESGNKDKLHELEEAVRNSPVKKENILGRYDPETGHYVLPTEEDDEGWSDI